MELKKKLPKDARKIDPFEIIPFEDDYDEADNGIICRPGRGDRSEYGALGNAVARIALAPIRSNLPVWGSYVDGKVFIPGKRRIVDCFLYGVFEVIRYWWFRLIGRIPVRVLAGRFITIFHGFPIMNDMW